MGNMLQYNGVTGKGSRVPAHGPASSSLGYDLPGSLTQGSLMSGQAAYRSGGQPAPPSRAGLPFWKVRPDGIETDVALVVDRLVAKVEGLEAAQIRQREKDAKKIKERQAKESKREEAMIEKEVRITLERLLRELEKDESLQLNAVGSLYLDYVPSSSGPDLAGLMLHMVHGEPCTEWFEDKAASFRKQHALETELRQALKALPRLTNKPGPKRKSEGGGGGGQGGQGTPLAQGHSPALAPRPARLEYVPPQVHRRGMGKIVLRRYVH